MKTWVLALLLITLSFQSALADSAVVTEEEPSSIFEQREWDLGDVLSGRNDPALAYQIDEIIVFKNDGKRSAAYSENATVRKFAVFIDVIKFFVDYVNQFSKEEDRRFASLTDFRKTLRQTLAKKYPNVFVQLENYRATSYLGGLAARTEGFGAGIHVDLDSSDKRRITITAMPLYGEVRSLTSYVPQIPGGTEYTFRSSVGAGYQQKVSNNIEAGTQIFIQPQWVYFDQFRVYFETYVRFRLNPLIPDNYIKEFIIQDVALIPKFVIWKSTDRQGLFGDSIAQSLGDGYNQITSHAFGFLNLEFTFRL